MPVFLPNSICTANLHSFLRHPCCVDWSENLGFECRDKPATRRSLFPTFAPPRSPRRSGSFSRKRLVKLNGIVPPHIVRQVKAQSTGHLQTLVLEREPDDAEASVNGLLTSNGLRRIEVVGKDIDLEQAMELLRDRKITSRSPRKPRKPKAKLEDIQSVTVYIPSEATKEVQIRLEGDAADLAEADIQGFNDIEAMMKALGLERTIDPVQDSASASHKVNGAQSTLVADKPFPLSRPMPTPDTKSRPDEKVDDSGVLKMARPLKAVENLSNEGKQVVQHLELKESLRSLRRFIATRKYQIASQLAAQLNEQYPENTDVLVEYAYIERQSGKLLEAVSLYSEAIRAFENQCNLGYDYIRALQSWGSVEVQAGNWQKARVKFMDSIHAARQEERRSPGTVDGAAVYGLHAWARMEEKLGNWSKAAELLTKAAEIQPGNAVVHQSRALLEARVHNWGAARYHFRLAVKAAPTDVKCWQAWAIFEGGQNKKKRMRQLFERALLVDPNNLHSLQAWAYQETLVGTVESIDKARSLYRQCIEVDPQSLFSWQAWAVMEQNSGNHEKARELFEKCLQVDPSSIVSLQAFAKMEKDLGNLVVAQKLLQRGLRLEPENGAVLMEAAFVEEALGNVSLAEKLFKLAGMADKRRSRLKHQLFRSRNAALPHVQKVYSKGKLVRKVDRQKTLVNASRQQHPGQVILPTKRQDNLGHTQVESKGFGA